jgi:uncharacterized protein YndB with AHSA1/START domain
MTKLRVLGFLSVMLLGAASAQADVVSAGPNGFELRTTLRVAAPSDKVYAAFTALPKWWSPDHTWYGKGENLSLEMKVGGCFCEITSNGEAVEHARVAFIAPGKMVRLRGALGPMQGMGIDGALTWTFKSNGTETDVTVENAMGGYSKDGLEGLAKIVDQVLSQQLGRLKIYAETGSVPAAKPASPTP